jgi:hypothetical protein
MRHPTTFATRLLLTADYEAQPIAIATHLLNLSVALLLRLQWRRAQVTRRRPAVAPHRHQVIELREINHAPVLRDLPPTCVCIDSWRSLGWKHSLGESAVPCKLLPSIGMARLNSVGGRRINAFDKHYDFGLRGFQPLFNQCSGTASLMLKVSATFTAVGGF